jgi:hypothetical protein
LLGCGAAGAAATAAAAIRPAVIAATATAARGVAAFRAFAAGAAAFAGAGLAAKHLHLVGDDVGAEALDAFLVGVLVGAQRPFDVDLAALAQVFTGDFGQLAEELDAVPFGPFLFLAGLLVVPRFGRGDADRRDRAATLGVSGFGIGAEIADQDDFVDAAGHGNSLNRNGRGRERLRGPASSRIVPADESRRRRKCRCEMSDQRGVSL